MITPVKGARQVRPYTVLFVKRDGRWLISSVREEPDPLVSPHDRLKDLEWMVGDWVDEGPDSEVRLNCRWSEDGNFLIRSFTVKQQGKPVMTVSQRIGWDPLARQIRSWEFDSEGGFGEGTMEPGRRALGHQAHGRPARGRGRLGHQHHGQGAPRPGALGRRPTGSSATSRCPGTMPTSWSASRRRPDTPKTGRASPGASPSTDKEPR